jgi:hypothetical protein
MVLQAVNRGRAAARTDTRVILNNFLFIGIRVNLRQLG